MLICVVVNGTEHHREMNPLVDTLVQNVLSEFQQQQLMSKRSTAQDLQQFQRLVFQVAESAIQLQLFFYLSAEEVVRDEQEVDKAIVNHMFQIKRVTEANGKISSSCCLRW